MKRAQDYKKEGWEARQRYVKQFGNLRSKLVETQSSYLKARMELINLELFNEYLTQREKKEIKKIRSLIRSGMAQFDKGLPSILGLI